LIVGFVRLHGWHRDVAKGKSPIRYRPMCLLQVSQNLSETTWRRGGLTFLLPRATRLRQLSEQKRDDARWAP